MQTSPKQTFKYMSENIKHNRRLFLILSFLMGIGHFPLTLLIVFITLLPIILIFLPGKTSGSVVYVMLIVGFAVLAYLNSYIFNHIFKKYMWQTINSFLYVLGHSCYIKTDKKADVMYLF